VWPREARGLRAVSCGQVRTDVHQNSTVPARRVRSTLHVVSTLQQA